MSSLIQIYKALCDESRLRILRVLLHGRYNVAELQEVLGMGQSRVSRHLKVLLDAELARVHREGTWAYYEPAGDEAGHAAAVQLELLRDAPDSVPHAGADEARRLEVLERRRRKSQAFHDRVAPEWERLRDELFGDQSVTARILDHFSGDGVVADLGCGPGVLLRGLVQRFGRVIGVDSSPVMLEEARAKLEAAPHADRIELRLGSLEHLPIADGEVDAALMNMVLHHLADPRAVFGEVRRVLADGGVLVVCDLARHDEEWMREKYGDQWLGFTEEELTRLFVGAGLELESIDCVQNTPRAGIILAVARAAHEGGNQ